MAASAGRGCLIFLAVHLMLSVRERFQQDAIEVWFTLGSLKVFGLNSRFCNLVREDADSLKQALVHMPNLEKLDLSDNSIEDGIGLVCLLMSSPI